MNLFFQIIFQRGERLANIPQVFFSMAVVSLLQNPAFHLIASGYVALGIFLNETVAIAGTAVLFVFVFKLNWKSTFAFRKLSASNLLFVVLLTVGGVIIMDYLTALSEYFFPLPEKFQFMYDKLMGASSVQEIAIKFFVLCVLTAVCEEMYFRGFCQNSFAEKWGTKRAIVIVAFIFALFHGNAWYMHLYFLLGLLFGSVYALTGSLMASIICHFINNSWVFFGHVFNFKLPLNKTPNFTDAIILFFGITLFTLAIFLKPKRKEY